MYTKIGIPENNSLKSKIEELYEWCDKRDNDDELGSSVECIASLAFGGWSSKAGLVDDNSKRYAVVYMKNNNIQIKDNAFNIGGYVRVVTL